MATYAAMLEDAKDLLSKILQNPVAGYTVSTGSSGATQTYTMRDIPSVQKNIEWLEKQVAKETEAETGRRTRLAVINRQ